MHPFKGRHFQHDIILWAVRCYRKYGIRYCELQEMPAERGVNVDHSTIYRWVQRYAPEIDKRNSPHMLRAANTWIEMHITTFSDISTEEGEWRLFQVPAARD